jgi:hypothetical protein
MAHAFPGPKLAMMLKMTVLTPWLFQQYESAHLKSAPAAKTQDIPKVARMRYGLPLLIERQKK